MPRWLRFFVPGDDLAAMEADMAELYELRRRAGGDTAARRWLEQQRTLAAWHLLRARVRSVFSWRAPMTSFWRDLVFSIRSLRRTPALAATIVLTVGLGLGAATAMISIVRSVLVNPLPYAQPNNLYWLYTDTPPFRFRFSVADYRALEADHPTFSAIAAYQTTDVTLDAGAAAPERVTMKSVTGSYFPLMGQSPSLGRLFDPSDDVREEPSVVLTYDGWTRRFGADPAVIGRRVLVDGVSTTIVGVLQPTDGPLEHGVDLFAPAHWAPPRRKGPFFTMVLGRLSPGVSRQAALDALRATNKRLFPIWKASYQDEKATWGILDLKARVVGTTGTNLMFVLAAVIGVLLIACTNAVNLLVGRGLHRSRELAIRTALGASRRRLLQHVLAESAVLAAGAAAVGAAVAAGTLSLVGRFGADYIARVSEIGFSVETLLWLAALAAASALVIGAVPAWYAARLQADAAMREGSRSNSDGPAARGVRRALVALEFALATPLIVSAVAIFVSLDRLAHVPIGADVEHVLSGSLTLSGPRYADDTARAAFWRRAIERLSAIPGVSAASISDSRPPSESGNQNNFDLEDHPAEPGGSQPVCTWVGVSQNFFSAVGMTLERGRGLTEQSLDQNEVVVDRAWANRFFKGEDAVGRRMREGGCTTCPWTTVVGVVSDVKWTGLSAEPDGTVYYPLVDLATGFVMLRAQGDPSTLTAGLRAAVKELDPSLPLSDVATGGELVSDALATPRYLSVLTAFFGATALVLAIVGVYGVMSFFVQQHTRDIGIRLALGGEPARVRRMIVLLGLRLVAAGLAVGIAAACLTGRLLSTLLFEISPTDIRVLAGVSLLLTVVAAAACWLPARRAAALSPSEVLRA